jgi:predicted aspartyl protease
MNDNMQKYIRVLGALALLIPVLSQAAGDAGSCRYVPAGQLDIEFSEQSRQPIVKSAINGVSARALIDTGAYTTFLMRASAERLGLRLNSTGRYSMGIGGASVIYAAYVNDFSLGSSHSGQTRMLVIGNSAMHASPDVVVGADLLLQTDMELSLAGKYLRFFNASGCADTHLAYWDRDAMAIPFARSEGNSNKPLVTVELNGVKLTALLDTGAARSSVTRHGAELAGIGFDAAGVQHGAKVVGVGDAALESRLATFDSFMIGDETIQHAQLTIVDDSPQGRGEVDMLLGVDFLRAHRVLFAMSQHRLYISYVGGSVFATKAP